MENNGMTEPTRAGTAGGLLLVLLLQISSTEILKTSVLAAVGAFVSFSLSVSLKWLLQQMRKK